MKRHFARNTNFAAHARRFHSVSWVALRRVLPRFCLWTSFTIGLILCQIPELVRAEPPVSQSTDQWGGIQRLQVNFGSQETAPFIAWNAPTLSISESETTPRRKGSTTVRPRSDADSSTVASLQNSPNESSAEDHRHQLRDTLARDGQSSLEGRDSLTREALSVVKWTVVTLVLGCVAVVCLKKFPFQKTIQTSSNRIRVLETLALGRQQGLKLVEVGGERFLIASDQGGIKNVTLLPNWPSMDQSEGETLPMQQSPPFTHSFDETLRKAAA